MELPLYIEGFLNCRLFNFGNFLGFLLMSRQSGKFTYFHFTTNSIINYREETVLPSENTR